jgi:hypothetical protein
VRNLCSAGSETPSDCKQSPSGTAVKNGPEGKRLNRMCEENKVRAKSRYLTSNTHALPKAGLRLGHVRYRRSVHFDRAAEQKKQSLRLVALKQTFLRRSEALGLHV